MCHRENGRCRGEAVEHCGYKEPTAVVLSGLRDTSNADVTELETEQLSCQPKLPQLDLHFWAIVIYFVVFNNSFFFSGQER